MDRNRLDVSAKELVWDGPAAWAERFGIGTPGPVSVIDSASLSTAVTVTPSSCRSRFSSSTFSETGMPWRSTCNASPSAGRL